MPYLERQTEGAESAPKRFLRRRGTNEASSPGVLARLRMSSASALLVSKG